MEGESATSPSNSSSMAGAEGASRLLLDLPSRGILPSTVVPSNPLAIRVYICDHNTSPPEEQLIKTNQTNILIRSLTLKKQKSEPGPKDTKGKATAVYSKGKRAAERALDVKPLAKKANVKNNTGSPQQVGTSTRMVQKDLQSLTVERLRALLKERRLSIKGKKDELIARLKGNRADGQP